MSDVRDFLFNIFAATLHIEDRASIRKFRARHVVLTATHLSRNALKQLSMLWSLKCSRGQIKVNCVHKTVTILKYNR